MTREQLSSMAVKKFGFAEGYKKYNQIIELLDYTYKHINDCGFALDFYEKIFDIL